MYVYIFSSRGCSLKLPWWLACGMIELISPATFVHLITQESLVKRSPFSGNPLIFLLFLSADPALLSVSSHGHTRGTDQSCDVWQWGGALSRHTSQRPSTSSLDCESVKISVHCGSTEAAKSKINIVVKCFVFKSLRVHFHFFNSIHLCLSALSSISVNNYRTLRLSLSRLEAAKALHHSTIQLTQSLHLLSK